MLDATKVVSGAEVIFDVASVWYHFEDTFRKTVFDYKAIAIILYRLRHLHNMLRFNFY